MKQVKVSVQYRDTFGFLHALDIYHVSGEFASGFLDVGRIELAGLGRINRIKPELMAFLSLSQNTRALSAYCVRIRE